MKYLYFSPFTTDCINASVLLEDAYTVLDREPDAIIYFLYFDYPSVKIHDFNNECSNFRSREIAFDNWLILYKYKHDRIITIPYSSIKKEDVSNQYEFSNLQEVKQITHNGINIGFGVVSNFVSFTANINPEINDVVKKYITNYLNTDSTILDSLKAFVEDRKIEYIKTFNGRFATLRIPVDLAENIHIPFSTLEMLPINDVRSMKYFEYLNDKPHSITLRNKIIHQIWTDEDEKCPEQYSVFYERRAKGLRAGDTVYTSSQNAEELPEDWDTNKKNYVYFTSSENEFFAIGDDWDKLRIFPDQEVAAETVAKICQEDPSIHLYIRIHPHLIGVEYSYAKFESLKNYPNVTLIPAESTISTYKMMFSCDKCITMGSSVGIEATYWGKPSVLLNASMYYYLDVAYIPRDINHLRKILLDHGLPAKSKKGCFQYAKFILSDNHGRAPKYVDFNMTPIYFKGKRLDIPKSMTILGSTKIYKLSIFIFRMLYVYDKHKYLKNVRPYLLKEKMR